MKGRNSDKLNSNTHPASIVMGKKNKKLPLTAKSIKYKQPDITFFYKNIGHIIAKALKDLYYSTSTTFLLDQINLQSFKKIFSPLLYAGIAYAIGNKATRSISHYATESEEYDFILKSIIGLTILAYSATHRITDKKNESTSAYRRAMASEILAIMYMYSSAFDGTQLLLKEHLSDNSSLIASLATSTMIIPGTLTYLTQKYQEISLRWLYAQGAQRSDTTTIFSGNTSVANTYFQANHFLLPEISTRPRLFQIALIAHNILKGGNNDLTSQTLLKKFKNLPAFLLDIGPPAVRKIISQKENIKKDLANNTQLQTVLKFTNTGPALSTIPRYKLRSGDLVLCDEKFDMDASPISGEIIALERDEKGRFTPNLIEDKYHVNLERNNGETNWIQFQSNRSLPSEFKKVDLISIRNRKQTGILIGTKVNFHNKPHFFIRVKPENQRVTSNQYDKKSVIGQIIDDHKRRSVNFAIFCSVVTAVMFSQDLISIPTFAVSLLLDLYQTFIPFSETVLREMVNSQLLKEINIQLVGHSTEALNDLTIKTPDAMRIVDMCNAVSGYYNDKFPQGPVIVTDKTGTLTTHVMVALGIWTTGMQSDVQRILQETEKKSPEVMPDKQKQLECFEVFASAFTNSKKEMEPEEAAILTLFNKKFGDDNCLKIEVIGNNYFKKTIALDRQVKVIETFHVSDLFRSLGGRCTLVDDNKNKYLIFCGVPKADRFKDMQLLSSYTAMRLRTEVLSRDWCIARVKISDDLFASLKELFTADKQLEAEKIICANATLLSELKHCGTFIIDNPVKKGAEKFIANFNKINVPVFIATGDTAKASENIARVLCPDQTRQIVIIRAFAERKDIATLYSQDMTVIFVDINDEILAKFDELMKLKAQERPVIIFSEMSTFGKGVLARHLKNKGHFVIANGDGSNDVFMMESAHAVIAHVTEKGGYARGVEKFVNLNDIQLQKISNSSLSLYELFDIHQKNSKFINLFAKLINTPEKPSIALLLKSAKLGFEAATAIGILNVMEMPYQHWAGVAFDMAWVGSSYFLINSFADLPMDKVHLGRSNLPATCALISMAAALLSAFYNYFNSHESTNPATMLLFYTLFLVTFPAICGRFGAEQNQFSAAENNIELMEDDAIAAPVSRRGFFGSCRRKQQPKLLEQDVKLELAPAKKQFA